MKITKQELKDLDACAGGYIRFIQQTNDTSEPVEVSSLIGGVNTYNDLLWLAGKKLSREVIVRFACDCALINIELIKPYTDKYEEIVAFLEEPTYAAAWDARDASNSARAAARDSNSAWGAARVADVAARAVHSARAAGAAAWAGAAASTAAVSPESKQKVDQLLIALFS